MNTSMHSPASATPDVRAQRSRLGITSFALAAALTVSAPAVTQASSPINVVEITIPDIQLGLASGTYTAVDLLNAHLDRINSGQAAQHLVGMFGRTDFFVDRGDGAVRRNQHRNPAGPLGASGKRTVSRGYRCIDIAQEIVREVELVAESLVLRRCIGTDPEDHGVLFSEIQDSITEPLAFDGSPRGIGFGIPPQQYMIAGEVGKADQFVVLVGQAERRRLGSDCG